MDKMASQLVISNILFNIEETISASDVGAAILLWTDNRKSLKVFDCWALRGEEESFPVDLNRFLGKGTVYHHFGWKLAVQVCGRPLQRPNLVSEVDQKKNIECL